MRNAPTRTHESDPAESGSTGIHAPLERVFEKFPGSDRILEKLGFDIALNKETPLRDLCRIHGLDPKTVARMLAASCSTDPLPARPASAELMSLSDLCEHNVQVDHVLLRTESFAKTGAQRALGQSFERIGRHFNEQVYRENQVLFRRLSALAAFS